MRIPEAIASSATQPGNSNRSLTGRSNVTLIRPTGLDLQREAPLVGHPQEAGERGPRPVRDSG
ncbi:hypothetical protein ACH4SP_23105 [Streptomyces sp. NPDC021093]|uniref:hypothetical protein n=1 Tax=Streptomyces sp. NPDC021093 TaxID=3365112 RepID=UPI00379F9836